MAVEAIVIETNRQDGRVENHGRATFAALPRVGDILTLMSVAPGVPVAVVQQVDHFPAWPDKPFPKPEPTVTLTVTVTHWIDD